MAAGRSPHGTIRVFPGPEVDLGAIMCDVARHFMLQGYGVSALPAAKGRWQLKVTRADVFARPALSGVRFALGISLWQNSTGTSAQAHASLWPSLPIQARITAGLLWPWIGRTVWECVESSGLDKEAICAVESALGRRS